MKVFCFAYVYDFKKIKEMTLLQMFILCYRWLKTMQHRDGSFLFTGGFLGMDNISVVDRSFHLKQNKPLIQVWCIKTKYNCVYKTCTFLYVIISSDLQVWNTPSYCWIRKKIRWVNKAFFLVFASHCFESAGLIFNQVIHVV